MQNIPKKNRRKITGDILFLSTPKEIENLWNSENTFLFLTVIKTLRKEKPFVHEILVNVMLKKKKI